MKNEMHMDLTVALSGELDDDMAMLWNLENEDSYTPTEPFSITFADSYED